MATKAAPEFHLDLLGQEVRVGNYVVASLKSSYGSTLQIAKVDRLTPMKIFLSGVKTKRTWSTWSSECVKLSGEDVLAFILTHG